MLLPAVKMAPNWTSLPALSMAASWLAHIEDGHPFTPSQDKQCHREQRAFSPDPTSRWRPGLCAPPLPPRLSIASVRNGGRSRPAQPNHDALPGPVPPPLCAARPMRGPARCGACDAGRISTAGQWSTGAEREARRGSSAPPFCESI